MSQNKNTAQDTFCRLMMNIEQLVDDYKHKMRNAERRNPATTREIYTAFQACVASLVQPRMVRIDRVVPTKPPLRCEEYTEEFMNCLVKIDGYERWYAYVRASVIATTRMYAPSMFQTIETGGSSWRPPILPLLIILDRIERQWFLYPMYPAKEIPFLISTAEFKPPIPRTVSWKQEQILLGNRELDQTGSYDSHLPWSYRHLPGIMITDSSARLNEMYTGEGNTNFADALYRNGSTTKIELAMRDGSGIKFAVSSVQKDNEKMAKLKRDGKHLFAPNTRKYIRFVFLGGNDNVDRKQKAIGTQDPTILPEMINEQANDMRRLVDALVSGPGVATVVIAMKADDYKLEDTWGRMQVQVWKAGVERLQEYVKLEQAFQEHSEDETEASSMNARELLGCRMVGNLSIPKTGVYQPNIVFVPMTEFVHRLELADRFHFRNSRQNKVMVSDLMEALADVAVLQIPRMYDTEGGVPKPYEDHTLVSYPEHPIRPTMFHLTRRTCDWIRHEIKMPIWMCEVSNETREITLKGAWRMVSEFDAIRENERTGKRARIEEDIKLRKQMHTRVMNPANAEDDVAAEGDSNVDNADNDDRSEGTTDDAGTIDIPEIDAGEIVPINAWLELVGEKSEGQYRFFGPTTPDQTIPLRAVLFHGWEGRNAISAEDKFKAIWARSVNHQRKLTNTREPVTDERHLCRTKKGLASCTRQLGCMGKKHYTNSGANVVTQTFFGRDNLLPMPIGIASFRSWTTQRARLTFTENLAPLSYDEKSSIADLFDWANATSPAEAGFTDVEDFEGTKIFVPMIGRKNWLDLVELSRRCRDKKLSSLQGGWDQDKNRKIAAIKAMARYMIYFHGAAMETFWSIAAGDYLFPSDVAMGGEPIDRLKPNATVNKLTYLARTYKMGAGYSAYAKLGNTDHFYNLTCVCIADDDHPWNPTNITGQVIKPAYETHTIGVIVDCRTPQTIPWGVKFGEFNPALEIEPMASMTFRADDYKGAEKKGVSPCH